MCLFTAPCTNEVRLCVLNIYVHAIPIPILTPRSPATSPTYLPHSNPHLYVLQSHLTSLNCDVMTPTAPQCNL